MKLQCTICIFFHVWTNSYALWVMWRSYLHWTPMAATSRSSLQKKIETKPHLRYTMECFNSIYVIWIGKQAVHISSYSGIYPADCLMPVCINVLGPHCAIFEEHRSPHRTLGTRVDCTVWRWCDDKIEEVQLLFQKPQLLGSSHPLGALVVSQPTIGSICILKQSTKPTEVKSFQAL